jgi:peptidoglycan/LPS O-acetylase OafA/YrhL
MTPGAIGNRSREALAIPSLDGLRAASFFLVFLGHAGLPFVPIAIPAGFGVTVFFFLSGYLITTLLRLEIEQHGRINLKHFYLRRVLRIWPPFYLVLVLACLLTMSGALGGELELPSVLSQAFHYANFWVINHTAKGMPPGTIVYWSLAVEEHFYLLFPALYAFLVRAKLTGKQQSTVFLAMCAVTLAWRLVLIHLLGASFERTYLGSDTRFDSMLFGCALAVYRNPILDLPKKDAPSLADIGIFVAGIATLLATFMYRSETFRETLRFSAQGLALYPVFVTAIRFPKWGPIRLLNLRFMRFLGTISYSLYLVHHMVIIFIDRRGLSPSVGGPLALAVSIAIATTIWLLVERPFTKLRKRLTHIGRGHVAVVEPAIDQPSM